jgi:probable HAF family extracellular repeat protein
VRHCFLWQDGVFQTIAEVPATRGTTCYGINNRGQIVGSYSDSVGIFHDFLLDGGTLIEINVPGLPLPIGGINDRGQIVGSYQAAGTNQCFLWENGVLHSIDGIDLTNALCHAINNEGQIAGAFATTENTGFVLSRDVLIPISLFLFTVAATGINDRGQVVGLFFDNSVNRGFIFDNGIATKIDLPVPDPLFQNVAINNLDDLVVTFRSFGVSHSRMIFVSPH